MDPASSSSSSSSSPAPSDATSASTFDAVDFIMRYESGAITDPNELAAGFQQLIDSGLAWQLQGGMYGRVAARLIAASRCRPAPTAPPPVRSADEEALLTALDPRHLPDWRPHPAVYAILAHLLHAEDQAWVNQTILGLTVTSDGFLIAHMPDGQSVLPVTQQEFEREADRLLDLLDLTPGQRAFLDGALTRVRQR